MIDGPTLRRRLDDVLRMDAELDSFCMDFFPEVHRRFSGQMERRTKVNLLLQLAPDRDHIVDLLDRYLVASSVWTARACGSNEGGEDGKAAGDAAVSAHTLLQHREVLRWNEKLEGIKAVIATVPAIRYLVGVAGFAATVAIVTRGFGLDPVTVVGGVFIVSGPMVALLALVLAARKSTSLVMPAMALTWTVLVLMASCSLLLLGSFFFSWPKPTRCLFQPTQCEPTRDRTSPHSVEGSAVGGLTTPSTVKVE